MTSLDLSLQCLLYSEFDDDEGMLLILHTMCGFTQHYNMVWSHDYLLSCVLSDRASKYEAVQAVLNAELEIGTDFGKCIFCFVQKTKVQIFHLPFWMSLLNMSV